MLGINREVLEFVVIALTTTRVGYSLWTASGIGASAGWIECHLCYTLSVRQPVVLNFVCHTPSGWELIGLVSVALVATVQEAVSGQHRAGKHLLYSQLCVFVLFLSEAKCRAASC